jgi:phenylpyruvate tautomerase PptA (4-oxalocrotonate tautomerase family)
MPLWKLYHPVGAYTADDKKDLAERITRLYTGAGLPAFYVGVVFQEVAEDSFYIGGEPHGGFVRIWIDHIARTFQSDEQRDRALAAFNAALAPYVKDRGLSWEFHIDETPFPLWSIQGYRPPLPGTPDEERWRRENKPSAPVGVPA